MKNKILLIFFALIFVFSASESLIAGQLDDFEKSATKEVRRSSDRSKSYDNNDNDSFFGSIIGGLFTFIFQSAAEMSMARVWGSSDPRFKNIPLRDIGDPDLSMIRTDLNYQHIDSKVWGLDGRIEMGYGPFGLQYRQTHYAEKAPKDSMDLIQIHGLFRLSGSNMFETDIGLGGIILQGNEQNSGFSMTCPINLYPHKNIGFRLSPTWSWINDNLISDYDGSIAYINKFYSVRAGFRRNETNGSFLQGPYFGISFHY